MDNINPKKLKRIEKIAKLADEGLDAITEHLFEIEDRLDEELPKVTDIISRMKGDKGDSPTNDELLDLIEPLIPDPLPPEKYKLTEEDKLSIASKVVVRKKEIREVIREKTIVKEVPQITNIIREIALQDTPKELFEKINTSEFKISGDRIDLEIKEYDDEIATLQNRTQLLVQITGGLDRRISQISLTPGGGAVDSVNGQTGVVVLTKSDVGLGNVDNTSDINKPVSTATQTALDLKANLASPTFTGTVTAPSLAVTTQTVANYITFTNENANTLLGIDSSKRTFSLSTLLYPSFTELSYVKGVTSAIQTQLNAKEAALTFSTGLTRATNTITANLSTGVAGGQTLIGSTSTTSGITYKTTTGVGTTGADHIFVGGNNGATEFMRILNSGNITVGLNTATATATPINVSFGGTYGTNTPGTVGNLKWDLYNNTGDGNRYGIGMSAGLMEFQAGVGGGHAFYVNTGTEALKILSSGNVGIATTSPTQKLHVTGNALVSGYLSAGTTATYGALTAVGGTTFSGTLPAYGTASVGRIITSGWDGCGFVFSNASSGSKAFSMVYNGDSAYFAQLTTGGYVGDIMAVWNLTGMTLGSVATPVNKLNVNGGVSIGANYVSSTAPTNGLIVEGKTGIAISAPRTNLDVYGTSVTAPTLTTDTGIFTVTGSSTAQLQMGSYLFGPYTMYLQTKDTSNSGGSYPLALNPLGGSVGIGQASPLSPLHVQGSQATLDGISVLQTLVASSDTTKRMYFGYNSTLGGFTINSVHTGVVWQPVIFNNSAIRAMGAVSQTATGTSRLDIGVEAGTPRLVFEYGATSNVWLVDNFNGAFRFFTPGIPGMSLAKDGSNNTIAYIYNGSSAGTYVFDTAPTGYAEVKGFRISSHDLNSIYCNTAWGLSANSGLDWMRFDGAGAIAFGIGNTQEVLINSSGMYVTDVINLGHATDTTLSRSSAGVLAVEGVVVPTISSTSILTNKDIVSRVVTTTDDSTAVIDVAVTDVYQLSAMANNTTFSFTGTPTDGKEITIRYKDNGSARTLTWTGFVPIGITLPTTTTAGKWGYVKVHYNSAAGQYHAIATGTQA